MIHPDSKAGKLVENLAVYTMGGIVVGLFMGGIYSLPAMRVCKGREPWLSASLSIGLAVTVFGLGYLTDTPILFSTAAWGVSLLLLLAARRLHGSLDGNLERFGLVHVPALLMALVLAALTEHGLLGNA